MIRLRDVSVSVPGTRQGEPERQLLRDITLDLGEHRIAVIGANGSGKSTLLRLLNGLRPPTSGTVALDDIDSVRDARTLRHVVAFVFSDPLAQLLMSTPIEDVELSLRRKITNAKQRQAAALALLEERGLADLAHQSIYDLSGGERQLVALTSVLAVDPRVVVADEPTTLLDLRNTAMLRRTFADLPQQLIFSTHDLDMVHDAERVLAIHDGTVAADGEPDEVVAWYRRAMEEGA